MYFAIHPLKENVKNVSGPTQPPVHWVSGSLNRLEPPGCEVDCSQPSSAEVMIEWNYIFTPSVYFHGVDRDFIFRY